MLKLLHSVLGYGSTRDNYSQSFDNLPEVTLEVIGDSEGEEAVVALISLPILKGYASW